MCRSLVVYSAAITAATLAFAILCQAQDAPAGKTQPTSAPEDVADNSLEKAVQNPVASLISVPLQNNTAFDIGPYNRTQDVLNLQPVIPMNISKDWMVITRVIQPFVWQPYPSQNTGGEYGLLTWFPPSFFRLVSQGS